MQLRLACHHARARLLRQANRRGHHVQGGNGIAGSSLDTGSAPSGLAIEGHDDLTVFWIGALAGQSLIRLELADGRIVRERRLLKEQFGRIRDVRIGPDGCIYMITDSIEGALYRLEPAVEQALTRVNRKPL